MAGLSSNMKHKIGRLPSVRSRAMQTVRSSSHTAPLSVMGGADKLYPLPIYTHKYYI